MIDIEKRDAPLQNSFSDGGATIEAIARDPDVETQRKSGAALGAGESICTPHTLLLISAYA